VKSFIRIFPVILCITAALAALAMLFHSVHLTRQVDVQHISYAFQLLQSLHEGSPAEFFLTPKKYPMMLVVPLAVLYAGVLGFLRLTGTLPSFSAHDVEQIVFLDPSGIYFVTRLAALICGVLLVYTVYNISKKIYPHVSPWFAVMLLLSSLMLLTFVTAMRPHVPEVFFTFLAFAVSYNFAQSKTRRNALLAFGSATLAFCVLQNGLFAFIFPLWAWIYEEGRIDVSRLWKKPHWIAFLIGSFFLASIIGYPYLWKQVLVNHAVELGLGNDEDTIQSPWGFSGFKTLFTILIGSETFLTVFALYAFVRHLRKIELLHPFLWSAVAYMACYALLFGSIYWTPGRYFLPFVPFLAIIGGPALASLKKAHIPLAVIIAVIHLKFALLGFMPDTFDQARAYILQDTRGTIATNIPHYFLDIPPTRASIGAPTMEKEKFLLRLPEDLPFARSYISLSQAEQADVVALTSRMNINLSDQWIACAQFIAAQNTFGTMFLWSEVEWGLFYILKTQRLGSNIIVYCKEGDLQFEQS
jgi:hypothetical protein